MKIFFYLMIYFLCFTCFILESQEISKKQDIAILELNSNSFDISNFFYEKMNIMLLETVMSMKRFNIIAVNSSLNNNDINIFLEKLSNERKSFLEIPEDVLAGKKAFTRSDWDNLIHSYIIIIPIMTYFKVTKVIDEIGIDDVLYFDKEYKIKYHIEFKIDIHIVDVSNNKELPAIKLTYDTIGEDLNNVLDLAILESKEIFRKQLREVDSFKIKTGITNISGDSIEFEIGNNFGIKLGDEFIVIRYEKDNDGNIVKQEYGLIVVKKVNEDSSIGQILISNGSLFFADQLYELPRFPIEIQLFSGILYDFFPFASGNVIGALLGVKAIHTRGFYRIRPIYGVELILSKNQFYDSWIPVRCFVGAQLGNLFIRRFQFSPEINIGVMTSFNDHDGDKKPVFVGIGARILFGFNFLATKNIKLGFDIGADVSYIATTKTPISTSLLFKFGCTIK